MADRSPIWRTYLALGVYHAVSVAVLYCHSATAEASAGPGTFTIKTFEIIYMVGCVCLPLRIMLELHILPRYSGACPKVAPAKTARPHSET
jgi:hypothetical protein